MMMKLGGAVVSILTPNYPIGLALWSNGYANARVGESSGDPIRVVATFSASSVVEEKARRV